MLYAAELREREGFSRASRPEILRPCLGTRNDEPKTSRFPSIVRVGLARLSPLGCSSYGITTLSACFAGGWESLMNRLQAQESPALYSRQNSRYYCDI